MPAMFPPRPLRSARAVLGSVGIAVACGSWAAMGCGGAATPCMVPESTEAAMSMLEGTWRVYEADGELYGTVSFVGRAVETTSDDASLFGMWELLRSDGNFHELRFEFDEALEGDVRSEFGQAIVLDVALVFGSDHDIYALQDDGLWTRWEPVVMTPRAEGQEP